MNNALYYGNNLAVLRESIADESVDLIYLDPPFNSNATYNVLFKSPTGAESPAQIEAFEDTWHWGHEAEDAFDQVMHSGNTDAADMLRAMRSFLGENDMMAYLAMMGVRLLELHRVLKPTGSIYLHCDPTASHYLKILLDAIFGARYFRNEIIWHYNTGGKGRSAFLRKHDVIFWYSKSDDRTFNWKDVAIQRKVGTAHLRQGIDKDGREYYEDYSPRKSGKQYRWYLDEGLVPMDVWIDIQALNPAAIERLGYPTQKPVALLERIVAASSNFGEVVLDPFCGCGTAVHAAQKLGRKWIGIDITHLAIGLIERRLKDAFSGLSFEVHGTPKDIDGARDLALRDKYQFQWWAVSLIDAQPFSGKKKGADGGIDGLIYFKSETKTERAIVSVKGGDNVSVLMIRDLIGVLNREKAAHWDFYDASCSYQADGKRSCVSMNLVDGNIPGSKSSRLKAR
jgi:DNA modification methylase